MVIYFHRNPKTYEIFYVGMASEKGRLQRPYKRDNRNKYWNNYVNKHGGFVVQIVKRGLVKDDATYWERWYISLLGKKIDGGQLVNISNGGESNEGYKQTDKQRMLSAQRCKERGNGLMMTKEARVKANKSISKALKGKLVGEKNPNFGNRWTDEMKKSLSNKKKGIRQSESVIRRRTYMQALALKKFIYDPNAQCCHLTIKSAADFHNCYPQNVFAMLYGKIRNRLDLSFIPIEQHDSAA